MGANTKYKNSVFSLLFDDPRLLRELYCAIEGVTLSADVPVKINTLQDVLFMDMINDISFEIGGKLVVLFEHQSTINPNMALRLLMYIARVYEKIIGEKNIYASTLVRIPRPEFYVLYNGVAPHPDEKYIKLSDAFEEIASLGLTESKMPAMELEVKVININHGRNESLARKSKTLAGYSAFVAKVREFEKETGDRTEAIKRAVHYCRNNDILKEFLEEHGTEVQNMLVTEWNWDDALAVRHAEGWEQGEAKGREEGKAEGKAEGKEEIIKNALAKGYSLEQVHEITGVEIEVIKRLQA